MKRKIISLLLSVCLAASVPLSAAQAAPLSVGYLPGVTDGMTEPAFWSDLCPEPEKVLAAADEIALINSAALSTAGTGMHDLRNIPDTFDGAARCASLKAGAAADAAYYLGWTCDETGRKFTRHDFDRIIANCVDSTARADMPVRFGVAVNRTLLTCFPYDGPILDDPNDADFDYQGLVGIRVNEPLAVFTASADGKFYHVWTSCCSGWVRAQDVALCADREEWLSMWDIPAEKRLVVWGDKLYTDYSKNAPEVSNRLITMGTVLERMDISDPDGLVINRLPIHNVAVYLPVRNEDGSCSKAPALINAKESISDGYLPLTAANLAAVALASLGDAYGWGGTLNNEDCTSLNRNIYACFGLDLPRNGNWQWPLSMPKADTAYASSEEKAALLDSLPLGALLNFPGHQMMYLGKADGKYYCISTVSSIMSPYSGKRQRSRSVQINTLDLRRANGQTWLEAVNRIFIPWQHLGEGYISPMPPFAWYHEGTAYCLEKKLVDTVGGFFRPDDTATRAVAVEAMWRAAGKPEPSGTDPLFADVESGASYEKAVRWAKQQGIVTGAGDSFFRPDDPVTREVLAVMLCREAGQGDGEGIMGLAGYEDSADISPWAYSCMGWAVRSGLIKGDGEGFIRPADVMTRAELAVVLRRSAELKSARAEAEKAESWQAEGGQ